LETLEQSDSIEARPAGRVRRIAFYVAVVLFALMIVFMSPLPYAVLGWFLEEGLSHRIHETSFGMIFALSMAGLLPQLGKPAWKLAQMWQMALPIWLVILAILLVGDPLDPTILIFLLFPALLFVLHPGRPRLLRPPTNLSRRLAVLTLVAAVPFVVFAIGEFRIGQEASQVASGVIDRLPDDATDEQVDRILRNAADTREQEEAAVHFGHWSAMAAYAILIVCLAGLASLRLPGWRVPAWGAGIASAVYGGASLFAPNDASAANTTWAILAIAWGVVFIVAAEVVAHEPKAAAAT
jgi:hypothetical protein